MLQAYGIRRQLMNENKSVNSKYIRIIKILTVIIGVLVIIYLLDKTNIFPAVGVVLSSMQALFFGIFFACLLSPLVKGIEWLMKKRIACDTKKRKDLIRGISVALSMAIMLFIIIAVMFLIIPQLGVTLTKIIPSFKELINNFNDWVFNLSDKEFWHERVYPTIESFTSDTSNWILGHFGVGTDAYKSLTSGIVSAFNILLNIFVGLILSIYILISKEKLAAQGRKLCLAVFRKKAGGLVMDALEEGARIFSGFFGAKILEAIVMGVICFFGMVLFRLPYATLVSVIVGVANIIPFFGPYIGTILGAAIIILINPWQALGFVIFMIVLVQFDANFLGPKILGHSTGLSALWVIVAILLFSGCFGIVGAFIGVPVFAWIYFIVKRLAEFSLEKQELPTNTENYELNKTLPETDKEK